MFPTISLLALTFAAVVYGQQAGTLTAENHPRITIQQCAAGGSCTTQQREVTLDSNWRWTHETGSATNCYTGNTWNSQFCPDGATCASRCAIDGADYAGTYGITASGNALNMKFVTNGPFSQNVGSRVYLMQDSTRYQMFKLKNQELTFDVDMANLPCGLNGAVYLVSMDQDGGMSRFSGNKAGAKYGTGYCDSQCPRDIKFINGAANVEGWQPSPDDENAGQGRYGTCCDEMDIWEANSIATALTPHVCNVTGQVRCDGNQCGSPTDRYNSPCDKDGCDFNSFRMGDKTFLGPGMTVDTKQKITVVTQFKTVDNTNTGALSEIRRIYVQNGRVIQNSKVNIPGMQAYDSISTNFCSAQKTVFGDRNDYAAKGGMAKMGAALDRGMVLVLSIWADFFAHMLWLDSNYPVDKDPSIPGVARGTCPTSSGDPAQLIANSPNANVIYSNIKYGPIGSTFRAA